MRAICCVTPIGAEIEQRDAELACGLLLTDSEKTIEDIAQGKIAEISFRVDQFDDNLDKGQTRCLCPLNSSTRHGSCQLCHQGKI